MKITLDQFYTYLMIFRLASFAPHGQFNPT